MSSTATETELEVLQPAGTSAQNLTDQEPVETIVGPTTAVAEEEEEEELPKSRAVIVIVQLTAITFVTSITTGLINVAIPRMAADLAIAPQLYYW